MDEIDDGKRALMAEVRAFLDTCPCGKKAVTVCSCGTVGYCSEECDSRTRHTCCSLDSAIDGALRRCAVAAEPLDVEERCPEDSDEPATCFACCEPGWSPQRRLFRSGCACQGRNSIGHVSCFVETAAAEGSLFTQLSNSSWARCAICQHPYKGLVGLTLRHEFWKRCASLECAPGLEHAFLCDGLVAQNEADVAVRVARQRVERLSGEQGDMHETTLSALRSLASVLVKSREYHEAARLRRALFARARAKYGRDDGKTISIAGELAQTLAVIAADDDRETISQAQDLLTENLQLCEDAFGPAHRITLHQTCILAQALARDQEKQHDALDLLRPAASALKRSLGPDHPMTKHALKLLGQLEQRRTPTTR